MDQVHVIRHQVLVEKRSRRQVARELGISRLTVRKYLAQSAPERREAEPRARPVWTKVEARVAAVLSASARWTGGKQQLTATRLHQLLVGEGHRVGVTLVKAAVAEWKRQRREVFIPLTYRPGELAEVDFFEVLVDIAGVRQKAWLFLCRLMFSGRDFGWIYERQDQISFLDGHVRAFAHLTAVPARLAYDNLRPAVTRILVGGERALTARFAALASHYLFEPCFCRPATGHDKGGVEARGKGLRGQLLVPIPSGPTLAGVNATLLAGLDARLGEGRNLEGHTIGDRWTQELAVMAPVPPPFVAAATTVCGVSPRALVRVAGATYSVWCAWAGLDVTVHVGPTHVEIVGPAGVGVPHPRRRFGQRSIDYRHYLRELARKPQAVRQVVPELLRDLGAPFPAAWARLEAVHGPREAARLFAKVLGQIEARGMRVVIAALERALADHTPLLLAVAPPPRLVPGLALEALPVVLRDLEVTSGCAADYDAWLTDGVA